MILKTVYLALCTTGLLWVNTAAADVPPPPALETPKATAVAPVAVTPPANPKLVGTPPPADPYPPLVPEMVSIPAGTFTMGCKDGRDNVEGVDKCEKVAYETPAHQVSVNAFQMGKTEVTFAEWDVCVADGVCPKGAAGDEGWGRGNRPVINVSWDDAQTYIAWLNKRTGKHYRLPTEAEWEYAVRGGYNNRLYSWGHEIGKNNANCDNDYCKDTFENTAPVGSFAANPYGLYDMHGNVWEWCQDKYHDTYQGAPTDGSAWESGDSPFRVLRGGSWLNDAQNLRSARRCNGTPDDRNDRLNGFRLVLGQE